MSANEARVFSLSEKSEREIKKKTHLNHLSIRPVKGLPCLGAKCKIQPEEMSQLVNARNLCCLKL